LFRADFELTKAIQDLAEELGHTDSKVIKDILEDFFLEQTIKRQREDVEDFIK
jgi:predicted DNA-binding protein